MGAPENAVLSREMLGKHYSLIPSLFALPLRGNSVKISGWNLPAKTRGMGYRWWKLHNPNFNRFDPCDRQTRGDST